MLRPITVSFVLSLATVGGFAQSDHQTSGVLPIVQGSVDRIVTGDHFSVLQGEIQRIGKYMGTGVAISATNGSHDSSFPLFHTTVSAVISDGNGGWFVASVANDDFYIPGLVHVKADKTIDENWGPAVNYGVKTMALSGNTLYVGGNFTEVPQNFEFRNGLAAFNATTGELLPWNPDVTGSINTIETHDGIVYVGGLFTHVGGVARKNIAAIDAATGDVLAWNPGADGVSSVVSDIAIKDDVAFVSGVFTTAGGAARQSIAAIDLTTGIATAWNPNANANSIINAIELSGTTLYVGGSFNSIGGQSRNQLAALDIATGLATTWNPNFSEPEISDIELSGTILYVAGSFETVNGIERRGLAAVNTTTGGLTTWNPDPKTYIICLNVSNDIVFAGSGNNIMIGWADSPGYSVIVNETGEVSPVTIDFNGGDATSMKIVYDVLYMSGSFTQINGQSRNKLAALDLNTGDLLPWAPVTDGDVYSLDIRGTDVYLGGDFSKVNNTSRKGLAAVHLTSGALLPWNADIDDGYVASTYIYGDRLYVGGDFTSIKGEERYRIAALDLPTGNVLSWNPEDVELEDVVKIKANANSVVIEDTSTGINSFDTNIGDLMIYQLPSDGPINDFTISNNLLIIGGYFFFLDQNSYIGLASMDLNNFGFTPWYPLTWLDVNGAPSIRAVAIAGSKLFVGGGFRGMDYEKRVGFGAFDIPLDHCSTLGTITADETTLTAPEGDYYQWFKNGEAVTGATEQTFELDQEATAIYKVLVEVNDCPNTWLSHENIVTSTERINLSTIRVYPNPVKAKVKIEAMNSEVQSIVLRNSLGIRLAPRPIENNTLDMTGLPVGYYILTIRTKNETRSVKLAKIE